MNKLIIQPSTKEEAVTLKAILKALKIKYNEAENSNPYNREFVAKTKASRQEYKKGKFTTVKKEDIKTFLNSL